MAKFIIYQKEMAQELGVSPRTMTRWLKSGKLIVKKLTGTNSYSRSDFERVKANF